jgi:uncharacterized protein (DUF1697 family)
MPRYAAFLRGVMPTNAKMPELKRAFEAAGFENVVTVLGSGNVVFDARKASPATLRRKAERAMEERLGRAFTTFVVPIETLDALLASDPYAGSRTPAHAKRVVTFLREAPEKAPKLPVEFEGAAIVAFRDGIVFGAYVPHPTSPVFMALIEKTFGKEQTTRTWDTVAKVAVR